MAVTKATVVKPGKWQRRAKWLAYVNVTWLGTLLVANTLGMVYACYFTLDMYRSDDGSKNKQIREIRAQTWGLIREMWTQGLANTVSGSFTLWMSIMLLRGTKQGLDSREAFGLCQTWRNISIAFTILTAFLKLGGLTNPSMLESYLGWPIISILWGTQFFIVCMYMEELEMGQL